MVHERLMYELLTPLVIGAVMPTQRCCGAIGYISYHMEQASTLVASPVHIPKEEWISQEDLCIRWKVSKKTIRRLRQSGKLAAFAITPALFRFRFVDILEMESHGKLAPAISPQRKTKTRSRSK
jgi:hypothetical protein